MADGEGRGRMFPATDDAIALVLVFSFVIYVWMDASEGIAFDLAEIHTVVLAVYLTLVGGAAVWALGKRAFRAWGRFFPRP